MTAKEYLIDKGIFSKHVLTKDSILVHADELIALMEGFAASKPLRTEEEVRERLLYTQTKLKEGEWLGDFRDQAELQDLEAKIALLKWFLKE